MPPSSEGTLSNASSVSKNPLKRPDGFVLTVRKFFDEAGKHSQGVIAIVVGLVVIAAGGGFWLNHHEAKSAQGRDALYKAKQGLEKELTAFATATAPKTVPVEKAAPLGKDGKAGKDAPKPPATPTAESVAYKKAEVDTQFPKSVSALKKAALDFSGTRPGFEAQISLGDLYLDHGDAPKAIPFYEKAVDMAPGKHEKAVALYSLGFAGESAGKYAEAIKAFDKSLSTADIGLNGDILQGMARSYEQLHDTANARSTYDKIISQLPNTPYAKNAEAFKAQLQ